MNSLKPFTQYSDPEWDQWCAAFRDGDEETMRALETAWWHDAVKYAALAREEARKK